MYSEDDRRLGLKPSSLQALSLFLWIILTYILDHEYNSFGELWNLMICEIIKNTYWFLLLVFANIWSLTPVLDTKLLHPWNFLGYWRVFCSDRVTLGGPLDEGWSWENQDVVRSLELPALLPILQKVERGSKMSKWLCNKLYKILNYGVQGVSGLMNTSVCQEGGVPQLHKDRCSCAQDLPTPCPRYLFIWQFTWIL